MDSGRPSPSGRHHSGNNEDTTDHHAYPYKNEVSLSIGTSDNETPFSTPTHHSPATPSPRMYGKSPDSAGSGDSDQHSDDSRSTHVPSPVSGSSKDSAVLMRRGGSEDLTTTGLDNPGFETETTARPLSSFGSGVQSTGNGKTVDKAPVAGKFNLNIIHLFPICQTMSFNRGSQPGTGESTKTTDQRHQRTQ